MQLGDFASRQSAGAAGFGVVSAEAKRLSRLLEAETEGNDLIGDDISGLAELLTQLVLLTLNAAIELNHLEYRAGRRRESAAGFMLLEELRAQAGYMAEFGYNTGLSRMQVMAVPEPAEPHPVLSDPISLIFACCSGLRFAENLSMVREVVRFDAEDSTVYDRISSTLQVRDREYRLVSRLDGKNLELSGRYQVLILHPGQNKQDFAVLVDHLAPNCIQTMLPGRACLPSDTPFPTRESWLAEDGSQIAFADWQALLSLV
ncbi:MAG: hypothetical protein KKI09_02285 [Spirochaetes bacterium]|nr:hypothetical protein [Spirochaetota bacterium]MBU0954233.1 hypothetical protein [Spirochaetota bacterium]